MLTNREIVELCEYTEGKRDRTPILGTRWLDDKQGWKEVKPRERYRLERTPEGEKRVEVA